MQGKRILGSQPASPCCQAVSPHPAPLTSASVSSRWRMNEEQAAGTEKGMAAPGAQACHLEPSRPAPGGASESLADVASAGLKYYSGYVNVPSPAPAWHPAFYQNCSGHLQPVSAGNSLSSQVIITTFSPVLKSSFDSPHTHWNRQMHKHPLCPACRDPPKARHRLLQRRGVWGKMQAMPSNMAWLLRTSCVCPDPTAFSPLHT